MVLLAACGGNTNQANTGGTSNNDGTKTTSNNTGGNSTGGGQKTPEQLQFEAPKTEMATKAPSPSTSGGSTTAVATQGTSGGQTAVATQGAQPTVAVPKSFKEAPTLTQQVNSGKLPKVADRLPKNPMVVQPVEKVGTYGGTWNMATTDATSTSMAKRTTEYEYLLRWKWGMKNYSVDDLIPNVAESWEAAKDGTEYTFKLREGMKWSDGEPFSTDDIVFWYEDVWMNDDLTPSRSSPLIPGNNTLQVKKVDAYTVVFTFEKPNGLFPLYLATPLVDSPNRYPAHYLKQFHKKYNPKVEQLAKQQKLDDWMALFYQKAGEWTNAEKPVLFAWRLTKTLGENTTQAVAERNPYYWKVDTEGNQLPYIDHAVYDLVAKEQVIVLKALNGEIGMQQRYLNKLQNKAIFYKNRDKGDYHFYDLVPTKMNTMNICLNLTAQDKNKRKVFRDKNFRIGLSYAIDRQGIIDTLYVSQSQPFQSAVRPESRLYNEKLAKQYTEYSVEKANQYLDKVLPNKNSRGQRLGPDGKPFVFTFEVAVEAGGGGVTWADAMDMIKQHWSAVGINISIKSETGDIWSTRVDSNQHDATANYGDGGLDPILYPYNFFPDSFESRYAIPWANWYTNGGLQGKIPKKPSYPVEKPPAPAIKQMKLYDQLRSTADPDKRVQLMKQLLQISQEQFWQMGIALMPAQYGIVKNNFHNVPKKFLQGWMYPSPAPTNPEQYYIEEKK